VMESGRGGLVTRLDENEFHDAVLRMLTDKALYASKKAETLPEAANWSSRAMAKRMIEAYGKILKNP